MRVWGAENTICVTVAVCLLQTKHFLKTGFHRSHDRLVQVWGDGRCVGNYDVLTMMSMCWSIGGCGGGAHHLGRTERSERESEQRARGRRWQESQFSVYH